MSITLPKFLIFVNHLKIDFFVFLFLWQPNAETYINSVYHLLLSYNGKILKVLEPNSDKKFFLKNYQQIENENKE